MTTLMLVRHAACERMSERLLGRTTPAVLSDEGRSQAQALARRFAPAARPRFLSSPRERAFDTATAIAAPHRVTVQVDSALDEIDYGEWTGLPFSELEHDPRWRAWNSDRESNAPPGGESVGAVSARILELMRRLTRLQGDACIVLVSHAEVIRSALLSIRGLSPNLHARLAVPPASVTRVLARGSELCVPDLE